MVSEGAKNSIIGVEFELSTKMKKNKKIKNKSIIQDNSKTSSYFSKPSFSSATAPEMLVDIW